MPRVCIEPGCDELPYGPRARRCYKHHEERIRKNNSEQKKRARQRLVERGMCTQCGTRSAAPGRRCCQHCLDRQAARKQKIGGREIQKENIRKTAIQRDIARLIVKKVHKELGEMLTVPTAAWDFARLRKLGYALATLYLYQRDGNRLQTIGMLRKSGSGAVATLIAEIPGFKLVAMPRRNKAKERQARKQAKA